MLGLHNPLYVIILPLQFSIAALFFSSYESAKKLLRTYNSYQLPAPLIHMTAAAIGETVVSIEFMRFLYSDRYVVCAQAACMVRVPTEVVKQRMQTVLL